MGKRLVVDRPLLIRFLFYQYRPCKRKSIWGRLVALIAIGLLFYYYNAKQTVVYVSIGLTAICVIVQVFLLFFSTSLPIVAFLNDGILLFSISIHANLLATTLFFGRGQQRYYLFLLLLVVCAVCITLSVLKLITRDKYGKERGFSPVASFVGVILAFVITRVWLPSFSAGTLEKIGGIAFLFLSLIASVCVISFFKVLLFCHLRRDGEQDFPVVPYVDNL